MIKLSDLIFQFLKTKGVKDVFMLPGGGNIHMSDSLGSSGINYVCALHEQAAAIAAESYAQYSDGVGCCLVTSGPGATNALTATTAAWIDSTPVIFISGQAKRADLMGDSGVRQMGSQEVDIISMVKSITKFAAQVTEPEKIKYYLEKAYYEATCGRKGPVWLDIPLDVQAVMLDEAHLVGFTPEIQLPSIGLAEKTAEIIQLLNEAKRPLFLAGNGIKLAGQSEAFLDFAAKFGIPVLATWKIIDMFDADNPLFFGFPGTLGQRYANLILQNCDLLFVLGSRLDSSLTAFNHANFAPKAKKIMADIDEAEIRKMKMLIHVPVVCNAADLIAELNAQSANIQKNNLTEWLDYCMRMKVKYPVVLPEYYDSREYVNTYVFTDVLSQLLNHDDVIVPESSGGAGEMTYQAFRLRKGQKMRNAAGLGSMGFGLPYAIGACIACGGRRTILINGDGAFQLNIQELQTLVRLNLPVKIFIWNNGGYVSIRNTQRNLFDGHFVACEPESGLSLPDITAVAAAYGLKTFKINNHTELKKTMREVLSTNGPVLCNVSVSKEQLTAPRIQSMKTPDGSMVSKPLEDMWPSLPADELAENMIL